MSIGGQICYIRIIRRDEHKSKRDKILLVMPGNKTFFLIILSAVLVGSITFWSGGKLRTAQVGGAYFEGTTQLPLAPDQPQLSPLDLRARSALIMERNSGIPLFEKNPEIPLPMASLTKLMTALVALDHAASQDVVEITAEDINTTPYKAKVVVGERYFLADLLKAMLIASANDATLALARGTLGSVEEFVRAMNEEARTLGMQNTNFTNPVGFDDPQHYTSAADLSLLTRALLNYPKLLQIVGTRQDVITSVSGKFTHELRTTNKLMLTYEEIKGLKTGYTSEALGNLIILTDHYYSILLGSPQREEEGEKIMGWVKENWSWN